MIGLIGFGIYLLRLNILYEIYMMLEVVEQAVVVVVLLAILLISFILSSIHDFFIFTFSLYYSSQLDLIAYQ
jgi:hypothetical protein